MNTEPTTNPNKTHKLRQLAAAAAVGALSFVGVGHNASAQEAPPTTEASGEYTPPAEGHETVRPEETPVPPADGHETERPEGAVTTTTAPPEYVPPADGHETPRPEGAVTTTTAAPAPETTPVPPADGHETPRPEGAVTTTTAGTNFENTEAPTEQSPATVSHDSIDSTQSEPLPNTGLDAENIALASGAVVGAGALVAAGAAKLRSKNQQ